MGTEQVVRVFSWMFVLWLLLFSLVPVPCPADTAESPIYRLRVHYTTQNIQGTWADNLVSLETTLDTGTVVALNLQLRYDYAALLLTDIIPSDTERVQWEYFQSEFRKRDNSNTTVAPGIIQIKARGRLRWAYPEEFPDSTRPFPLFVIRTLVTNDRTYECRLARIDWLWNSCEDNVLQIDNTETMLISRLVLDAIHRCEIQDSTVGYPSRLGAHAHCKRLDGGRTERLIDFVNGGPKLMCFSEFEVRGDMDLNGIACDSNDYALYHQLLLQGLDSIKSLNPPGTVATSDLNGDGRTVTVSDLVYLRLVIAGYVLPPPCQPTSKKDTAVLVCNDEYLSLSTRTPIGGLYLKIAGRFEPELFKVDATLTYSITDDTTRILILSRKPDTTSKLTTGPLLRFRNSEKGLSVEKIDEAQASSILGYFVTIERLKATETEWRPLPDSQAATGFVDSPFTPTTTIEFVLSQQSFAELWIFNVVAQPVKYMPLGVLPAGVISATWDGKDATGQPATSGVYFFRLVVGPTVVTKKLVYLR